MLAMGLGLQGASLIGTEPESAVLLLSEAVSVAGGCVGEAETYTYLNDLGFLKTRPGMYGAAAEHFNNAARYAKSAGDAGALGGILINEGFLLCAECRYADAISKVQASMSLHEKLGFSLIPHRLLVGQIFLDTGDDANLAAILPPSVLEVELRPDADARVLVGCLSRYLFARQGRADDVLEGFSGELANLTLHASRYAGSDWDAYIGLHLESLCHCLGAANKRAEAARLFGAAQSARERALQFISPSVRGRWDRLSGKFGLSAYPTAIEEGARLDSAELRDATEAAGGLLLGGASSGHVLFDDAGPATFSQSRRATSPIAENRRNEIGCRTVKPA